MIGRWHSSCLHRNRVDFSLHQTLFKRQLRHFFHNCLVGKSVAKKTWKTILFPKKRSHKNVSIGFELVLPRNNVFSQKYIYDKCISLKILLCLAVLWQSVTVCENQPKNIIFLTFHIFEFSRWNWPKLHLYSNCNMRPLWGDFQTLCQSVLSRTFVIWSHVFRSRHDIFRK